MFSSVLSFKLIHSYPLDICLFGTNNKIQMKASQHQNEFNRRQNSSNEPAEPSIQTSKDSSET
jgi:hypothetical protein